MSEILGEILNDAQTTGRITLLKALNSYKKVTEKREILAYSDEGAAIYKTLLQWGREKNVNWHKKYSEMCKSSPDRLNLYELNEENLDSPPTHDSPHNGLQITLPKFQNFHKESKQISANSTLAQAFRDLTLRKKTWRTWLISHEKEKINKINQRKIEEKLFKKNSAIRLYEESLKRKSLESWTRLILQEIRKNVAEKNRDCVWRKRFWAAWRKALKKREILKGMKFTACFIHNQWLTKKSVLALTRNVHTSMMFAIKNAQLAEKSKKNLAGIVLEHWKKFLNLRLKAKILKLKAQNLEKKIFLKRGFKRVLIGVEIMKFDKALMEKGKKFAKKRIFVKIVHAWFSVIVENYKKKMKTGLADEFYSNGLKRWMLECLKYTNSCLLSTLTEKLKEFRSLRMKKLLRYWNAKSKNASKSRFPGYLYYIAYLLFSYSQVFSFESHYIKFSNKKKIISSSKVLHSYIKNKLFSAWKNYSTTLKCKKKAIYTAKLKKIFLAFKEKIERKQYNKFLLDKVKTGKKRKILTKILTKWQKTYSKISNNKQKFKQFCIRKKESKEKAVFSNWFKKSCTKIRRKKEKSLVPGFVRESLTRKYLKKWGEKYEKMKKKAELDHIGKRFFLENVTSKCWSKWRTLFLDRLKQDFNSIKTNDFYTAKLLLKCCKGWRSVKNNLRLKNKKKGKAADQLEFVLKVKSLRSWKEKIGYVKSKRVLYNQLKKDRNVALKKNVFKYFNIYAKYRQKSLIRDNLLTSEIIKNRKKYTLSRWYQKALTSSSTRYFEKLFNSLLKKEVIFRIGRFIKIEANTISYLEVYHKQFKVKATFLSWKKIILQKKILQIRKSQFKTTQVRYAKLKPFKSWRRLFLKKVGKAKILGDVLENSMLLTVKKRVLTWKKNTKKMNPDWRGMQRKNYLTEICFFALKRFRKRRIELEQQAVMICEDRMEKSTREIWEFWVGYVGKQKILKKNMEIRKDSKKEMVFNAWKIWGLKKIQLKLLSEKAKKQLEEIRKRVVVRKMEKFMAMQQEKEKKKQICQKFTESRLKLIGYSAWIAHCTMKKDNLKKMKKIVYRVEICKKAEILHGWQFVFKKSRTLYRISEIFASFQKRFEKKTFFDRFSEFNANCLSMQKAQDLMVTQFRKKSLKTLLAAWVKRVDKSKSDLIAYKKIADSKRKNILKLNFQSWNLLYKKTISKDIRKSAFAQKRLTQQKRLIFSALKQNSARICKIHEKFSNFLSQLKSLKNSENTKKIFLSNSYKANLNQILSTHLSMKKKFQQKNALKSLYSNLKSHKQSKQYFSISSIHFYTKTLSKFFKKLRNFKKYSKTLKLHTTAFQRKISSVTAGLHTKSAFFLMQKIFLLQKQTEVITTEELSKSLLKRLMQAWLKQAKIEADLLYKQEIVSVRHDNSLRFLLLQRWIRAYDRKKISKKIVQKSKINIKKSFIRLWKIELQIREKEQKRQHKYLVYAFAGLQIYSEKTFQAVACLKKVSIYETFAFVKKVFESWKGCSLNRRKKEAVIEMRELKITRYVMDTLKNNYFLRLITKKVLKRYQKNSTFEFFNKWQKKLKNVCKRRKVVKNCLMRKGLKLMQFAFTVWTPQETHSSLEETRIKSEYFIRPKRTKARKLEFFNLAVNHYESNLLTNVFYAWDNTISQYSVKRRRTLLHSIFSGWKIVTRESSLLKKYLIESNLSERYLRTSREINTLKSISSVGSLNSNN